jgi:LuxR family maltose regulon positive regulatory protein
MYMAIPSMSQGRQEATLRRWLTAIPDELFEARPVLAVGWVAMRLVSGEVEGVEARLLQAERWLAPSAQPRGDHGTGRRTWWSRTSRIPSPPGAVSVPDRAGHGAR